MRVALMVVLGAALMIGCSDSGEITEPPLASENPAFSEMSPVGLSKVNAGGFSHGPVVSVGGEDYYLAGAPDGPGGATDIPGHFWIVGKDRLQGKHYNTGPFGTPQWWSSDAPDGALLYQVDGVIDTWTPEKAAHYAKRGFVHYHELVKVADGHLHRSKVLWLRHKAHSSFTLDGGPQPQFAHEVTPGIDYEFIPVGMMPYDPEEGGH